MRTFIALDVPDEFRSEVAGVARRLATVCAGRFAPYESYHVTLAFLGEVCEAESALAVTALEAACAGAGPCELRPEGLGKFGRPQDATLWLGLATTPGLVGLAQAVRAGLRERGLAFDDKEFRPHVTLARRARIPRGALPSLEFPEPTRAEAVTLYKSTLDPQGATYKPLHTVTLG